MKRNRKETVQLLYMKRLIYSKNLQSLDLLVSALKNDRLYKKCRPRYISAPKKRSSSIYLGPKNLLCNRINWVSRIEEQRRIIKNNEEKNPKLLFVLFKCVISIIPMIYMI